MQKFGVNILGIYSCKGMRNARLGKGADDPQAVATEASVIQWGALDCGWSFWVIPYKSKEGWAFACLHQQSLAVNPLCRLGSFRLPGAIPSEGHSFEPSCQLRISRIIDKS